MFSLFQAKPQLQIFEEILGFENYKPTLIATEDDSLFVQLEAKNTLAICPRCGHESHCLHQNHRHLVRDLPWNEKEVYLQINSRQFKCKDCGKPFTEVIDIKPFRRSYTIRFAMDVVDRVLVSNIATVSRQVGISEYQIQHILDDVGNILKTKKPENLARLGIDEFSLRKGSGRYCAVLVDLDTHEIVGLLKSRKQEEIRTTLLSWGSEVLAGIKVVTMDLYKSFKSIINEVLPDAEVVADRFHVMKQVNDELDSKRKEERRKAKTEVKKAKSKSTKKQKEEVENVIKGSKYPLPKNADDLKDDQKEKLEAVKVVFPELGQMYDLKEEFRKIFEESEDWYQGTFKLIDWIKSAASLFSKSCETIIRWFAEITGYFEHHISSGCVEGVNNKIKLIKRCGYGFRNFENFRVRVLLSCAKSTDLHTQLG
jgi:transposase